MYEGTPVGISVVPESMTPAFIGEKPSVIETGFGAPSKPSEEAELSSGRSPHGDVPSMYPCRTVSLMVVYRI